MVGLNLKQMGIAGDEVLRTPGHSTFQVAVIRFVICNYRQGYVWMNHDGGFLEVSQEPRSVLFDLLVTVDQVRVIEDAPKFINDRG